MMPALSGGVYRLFSHLEWHPASVPNSPLPEYVGLSEDQAREKASAAGLEFRATYPGVPVTTEWRSGRVTALIIDDRVVQAELA